MTEADLLEFRAELTLALTAAFEQEMRNWEAREMGFRRIQFPNNAMIKTGKVELGKTPSVVTGKPSKKLVKGEPLAEGEKEKQSLEKLARAVGKLD